jgi:excisionase family DNA binding protein
MLFTFCQKNSPDFFLQKKICIVGSVKRYFMELLKLILDGIIKPILEEFCEKILRRIDSLEKVVGSSNKKLDRKQTARELQISPNTVSKWVREGRLNNIGVGKKYLFYESDINNIKKNKE